MSASFTPEGRFVVQTFRGFVIDVESGLGVRSLDPKPHCWCWYRSGGGVAWSTDEKRLRICDVASGRVILEREMQG